MRALRRLFGLLTLVAVAAGGVVLLRRRFTRPHERVDVYYEDGSMDSFAEGSPEAQRLLPLAYDVLRAAGS